MENYAMVNEQLMELGLNVKNDNPYKKWEKKRCSIMQINIMMRWILKILKKIPNYEMLYKYGNYYNAKDYANQIGLHRELDNLLKRFTYENGWNEELWNYPSLYKAKIVKNMTSNEYEIQLNLFSKELNYTYFKDEKIARDAINTIIIPFEREHPEFVW